MKSENSFTGEFEKGKDKLALLEFASQGLKGRIDLIEKAKNTIEIEYFAMLEGETKKTILGLLNEASKRGVKIRIVMNKITSGLSKEDKEFIAANENMEVRFYQPRFNFIDLPDVNKNLHDKILLVDSKELISGGRNIGDQFFDLPEGKGPYSRDRDIYIIRDEKNIPLDVLNYFNELWNNVFTKTSLEQKIVDEAKSKKNIDKIIESSKQYENKLEEFMKEQRVKRKDWFTKNKSWQGKIYSAKIQFIFDEVGKKKGDRGTGKATVDFFNSSKKTLFIQSPYIIPTKEVDEAFVDLKNRNIDVKVITNSVANTPNIVSISAYMRHRKNMLKEGLNIFEYQGPNSLHHKSYIIDETVSVIGSYNLDPRSQNLNTEMHYVIDSKEFAKDFYEIIKDEHESGSLKVLEDGSYETGGNVEPGEIKTSKKVLYRILRFIAPIYEWMV